MRTTTSPPRAAIAVIALSILAATLTHAPCAAAEEAQKKEFSIRPQPLAAALIEFSKQSNRQIVGASDVVRTLRSNGVKGSLSVTDALESLLDGTGLRYELVGEHSVRILAPSEQEATHTLPTAHSQDAAEPQFAELAEVVVTGTRIRGQAPVGSELITLSRVDLEQAGRATVAEVLKSIPQIQTIGTTEGTRGGRGQGEVNNVGAGTAVNLRGLGADATLTLVNGRRMAPSAAGAFVDISQIPMAAVERIEILPDGASALYGSDAIGGVINFVLRKDFSGAETALRYGGASGFEEYSASQVAGTRWGSGSLMAAFEHFDRSNLIGADRYYYRSDLTSLGGSNFLPQSLALQQSYQSNPGTIVVGNTTYAIPADQDGLGLGFADLGPAGSVNVLDPQLFQDILPAQQRNSFVASIEQDLTSRIHLFADLFHSQRKFERKTQPGNRNLTMVPTNPHFITDIPGAASRYVVRYSFADDYDARVEGDESNSSGTLGASFDLAHGWVADIHAHKGRNSLSTVTLGLPNLVRLPIAVSGVGLPPGVPAFNPHGDGAVNDPATLSYIEGYAKLDQTYDMEAVNVGLSGRLFDLPGGAIRMAIGGDYREEELTIATLRDDLTLTPTRGTALDGDGVFKRDITAGYAELLIPLFGDSNARSGLQRLDLSAAVRTERYSDFGSSTNPKLALTWSPIDDLALRGSWSTSFKAPRLLELNDAANVYRGVPFVNPAAVPGAPTTPLPGRSNAVVLLGFGNAELDAETAETWTIGADWQPAGLPGFRTGVTYYSVEYKDRILSPTTTELSEALAGGVENDIVVSFAPTQAELDAIYNSGRFFSFDPQLPANEVYAIVSTTASNYGSVKLSGLDANASYQLSTDVGTFTVGASGTYQFNYDVQRMAGQRFVELLNTTSNPNRLRARATATWAKGPYQIGIAANKVGSYTNALDQTTVDSWVTTDVRFGFQPVDASGLLSGLVLSLDIENALDEDPPFVNNGNAGSNIGYDPEFASPRGRVVSLTLRKVW